MTHADAAAAIEIIEAPINLGLRPLREGHVPGAWRAPAALRAAGLHARLSPRRVHRLTRPPYDAGPQPGTRIRNGQTLRSVNLELARQVAETLKRDGTPVVVGGDCSILLGCLLGARWARGRTGLVHVDGHSDFFHPGNYDTAARLGSAAGMDLALATGRGEPLLTTWPGVEGPLVADADVVQIGERDELEPEYAYRDVERTQIHRIPVRAALAKGVAWTASDAAAHLRARKLPRVWLHVDLDVLDEGVMPAVDSPGAPGFDHRQLAELLAIFCRDAPVIGVDLTVFDPDLDPDGAYARALAASLGEAFRGLGQAR